MKLTGEFTATMPKQLGDFLKEQQEPFALEVYLLEKGYLRNSFNSEHISRCSAKNSTKILNRSASYALNKKRKFIPNCSKIRTFLSRLVPVSHDHKIKNLANGDQEGCIRDMKNNGQKVADVVSNSCSDGDREHAHYSSVEVDMLPTGDSRQSLKDGNLPSVQEDAADTQKRRNAEETYQLSPVSVLEETESYDRSPVLKNILILSQFAHLGKKAQKQVKRIQEASSLSVPLCNSEKPFNSSTRETQEINGSKDFARYTKNKKAVLKTKQLLFDCVKEVVEKQRRKNMRGHHQFQKILGAEELGKLIYENIGLWSKDTLDETNIEARLHFDLLASAEEWSNFEQQKGEMAIEIGDAIFEDISNQIIADMLNFVS